MSWILLLSAGLFEVCWAVGLKYSQGLTLLWPSVITAAAMLVSIVLLAFSLKHLPLGTAYAIWTGIGAVGTVIAGMILFNESVSFLRIVCLLLIVTGIAGLKFLTKTA